MKFVAMVLMMTMIHDNDNCLGDQSLVTIIMMVMYRNSICITSNVDLKGNKSQLSILLGLVNSKV